MLKFPSAKINLGLNVLFKREDGYHELETALIQVPFFDILEILPSHEFVFKQSGLFVDGNFENNLCVKAFRLIQKNHTLPNIYLHLNKIIPMGAGLGGGSADAAFVIRMLNECFELKLSVKHMQDYASQLGSDCPFFISDVPQLARGRGEILQPIDLNLKGYYIKLINIGLHVSTKDAFSNVVFSNNSKSIQDILLLPIESWKKELKNDFEISVFKIYPQLADIKNMLYGEGAVYASMSGSGSTMFGIYKEKPKLNYENDSTVLEKILQL